MVYLGDFPTGETIYIPFHTFDSNDPSASVTISDFVIADVVLYKNGGTTQRTSTSGFTLLDTDGIDFDGVTGIHGVSIDTSDNTDAGFYAVGSDYWVKIGPITIDAATINFVAAIFSIDNRGLLRPTVAQRTLDITTTGGAGIDWGNVENQSTTVDLSATDIQLADTVTTVTTLTGHTAQTGDSFIRLGAPAAASVSADILAIDNFVDGLESTIGTAGAGLTDITLNAASIDLVWDEVLIGATHNITNSSGRRLRALQEFQGYEGGMIWVDTVNGTAGTTDFENGTVDNPVLTWADALTLNASLELNAFHIASGSTITLSASSDNYVLVGINWTLVLNGQSITDAYFSGSTDVSGISSGTGSRFEDCHIKTCSLAGDIWVVNSRIGGTVTLLTSSIGYFFQSCFATTGTVPIISLVSLTSVTLCLTPLTGGVQITNSTNAGNLVHIEGGGEFTLAASCTAGTLEYAGDWRVTDNSASMILSGGDNTTNIAAILVDTSTTLQAELDGIQTDTEDIQTQIGTAGAGLTSIPWNAAWDAEVESEVNDAIDTVIAELGVAAPAATPTLRTGMMLMYMAMRNKLDVQTSGTDALEIHNDSGTQITSKLLTDDGADYSEAKMT